MNPSKWKKSIYGKVPRVVCYAPSNNNHGNPETPGYVYAADEALPYIRKVELILPIPLIDQFKAEENARALAELLAAATERDDDDEADEADEASMRDAVVDTCQQPHAVAVDPMPAPASTCQDPTPAPMPLDGIYASRASVPIEIFGPQELSTFSTRLQKVNKSDRPRLELIEKQLNSLGNLRHRVVPLCQERPDLLDALLLRFPHFAEVIRIYQISARAGAARGQPMSPPPILMLGVPGVGKTHFAQALAACMGLPLAKLSFDSGLTNSVLLGSDQHWGNTHHGHLFEHLCLQQVANPVFLLDEIDKSALHLGSKGQSALAALHTCLEPASAASVRDISVGVTMDASRVVWLAAANQAELIPHSIRSRFTEVTIRPPVDPQQLYQLNWHLCQAVVEPLGVQMPDSTIRTSLAVLSPRDQRKHLQAACESAAAHGRNWLEQSDFAPGILQAGHGHSRSRGKSQRSGSRSGALGGMLH